MSSTATGGWPPSPAGSIRARPGTGTGSLVAGYARRTVRTRTPGEVSRAMSRVLTVAANPFQTR